MPYSTQNGATDGDIAPGRISVDQLKQLTSEDGLTVVQKVVDDAIADADADVDSYCGRRYTVPFNPVPGKVKSLSADLAVYNLFEKRAMQTGGEVPPAYRKTYEDAISFLKDVANGKAVIDGAVVPPENPKRTGGSFNANDRVFSKDSLDKL